jgi:asparagine synthetase B (glutamine-hydrolysing)
VRTRTRPRGGVRCVAAAETRSLCALPTDAARTQGHFAFYLYDTARKSAFAARDPSGQQELFYTVESDTCSLYITNCMERLPAVQVGGDKTCSTG